MSGTSGDLPTGTAPAAPRSPDDRVCVHCEKVVDPDRERLCNHCGLPFRGGSEVRPAIEAPGSAGRLVLKPYATLAFVLPALGSLSSLSDDPGTRLGFLIVVIAAAAALVFAWRQPLAGGILVALVGSVTFVAELILDASGAPDPSSRYWLFWFFPGSLVGGTLFLAAAFWRAPEPSEPGRTREGAGGPGRVSLAERVRREAIGLAVLVAVGLVFVVVMASYESWTDTALAGALSRAILLAGFPLLLVGAGVLGYREDRARGAFVAGLAAAVLACAGLEVAVKTTGQTLFKVGEGEWIGEAYLAVGLLIVGGGFFGLLGGGLMALIRRCRPGLRTRNRGYERRASPLQR